MLWRRLDSKVLIAIVAASACGDGSEGPVDAGVDAGPPDAMLTPGLSPPVELGLLAPNTPTAPFGHTYEPAIAVHGASAVVAYINYADADPASYTLEGDDDKRVAVASSFDGGATFGDPIDPRVTTLLWSTDPVVRVASDGSFWLGVLGQNPTDELAIAKSSDALSWTVKHVVVDASDKEWFALDDTSLWLAHATQTSGASYHRIAFDGTILAESPSPYMGGASGVYVDTSGAHVSHLPPDGSVDLPLVKWTPPASAEQEGALLATGIPTTDSPTYYLSRVPMGATPDGGQWIVRTKQQDGRAVLVLRIRHLPSDEGTDAPISTMEEFSFLPAALVDADGRLRVVYYDSAGGVGVLKTTRSLSSAWADGFEPPTVIDPEAGPGNDWFPFFDTEAGGRRLREYIDIASQERRIYVAWTHSPVSPSRVRVANFDY